MAAFFFITLALIFYWVYNTAHFSDLSESKKLEAGLKIIPFEPEGVKVLYAGKALDFETLTLIWKGETTLKIQKSEPSNGAQFEKLLSEPEMVLTESLLKEGALLPEIEKIPLPLLNFFQEFNEFKIVGVVPVNRVKPGFQGKGFIATAKDMTGDRTWFLSGLGTFKGGTLVFFSQQKKPFNADFLHWFKNLGVI